MHSKLYFSIFLKVSFSNTLDQIRWQKPVTSTFIIGLVQDYDSLKVNNKIANINMFYDLLP
nr:hypothetical protein [Mycoplasmopsis bovis]